MSRRATASEIRCVILIGVALELLGAAQAGEIKKVSPPFEWPGGVGPCIFPVTRHLFNGETLDGWEVRSGSATFHIEDGAIVGTTVPGSPNTFLCTKQEYGNFELKFDVKVDPKLNSGVQIRSHAYTEDTTVSLWRDGKEQQRQHKAGRVYGYQVELASGTHSGSVYDEARLATWLYDASGDPNAATAFKDGSWNRIRVRCDGARIQTWVNGVPCSDFYDPTDQTGFIGLQVHSYQGQTPVQVRWRNIRIYPLGHHRWMPIFDGQSLTGWTPIPDGHWEVRDGVLIGTHSAMDQRRGLLACGWRAPHFCAQFSFKVVKGNSGFCFRCDRVRRGKTAISLRAEIDAGENVGGLYEMDGRGWVVRPSAADVDRWFRPGQWNKMTVCAHENRIAVYVNGHKMADWNEDPQWQPCQQQPKARPKRWGSTVAFELPPGQDVEVHFRDIEGLGYDWPR